MPATSHTLKQKLHTIIFRSDTPAGKRFDSPIASSDSLNRTGRKNLARTGDRLQKKRQHYAGVHYYLRTSALGMCITQGLDRIMAGIDTLLLFRQHRPHLLAKLIFL